MKLRKILIKVGVGFLALVAAVLVVRAVLNFTEGRALARTLAALKAQGVPLTARDLAPFCPDEDNAARLLKAFDNITTIPGRPTSAQGRPTPKNGNSEIGKLITRAWQGYAAGKPITPTDRAALKDEILKNEKALAILAEMVDKPCFLFRDPADPLLTALAPFALQTLQMARLMFFSILFGAEEGDWNGAIDRLAVGAKLMPLMAREGTQISYLISLAGAVTLLEPLGEISRGREIPEEDLTRLMAVLDPSPWRDGLASASRGERVLFVEVGGDILKGSLTDLGSIWEGAHWWQELGIWVMRPLIKRDIRRSLSAFDFLEAQAKLPYYQNREALRARDQGLEKRPWYAFLSKMMLGGSEAAFMKTARVEAIILASRAGLACRLYKSRNGGYPERLEDLVPALLPEVPIDPFTGKPLVYRREGEGFIVYSLGSNEKDDGGRSTFMITQLVMDKDDDWSWKEDR